MELVLEEEESSICTKPVLNEEFKQKMLKKIYDKDYIEKTLRNAARKINLKYSNSNNNDSNISKSY